MSSQSSCQIVWFKRDLRIQDHAPLSFAAQQGPVLPVYIFEPALWRNPDSSLRQWRFVADCLIELDAELRARGQGLYFVVGEANKVFKQLTQRFHVTGLWSHQETGNAWTFARDQQLKTWFAEQHIPWFELPQHPVQRGNTQRDHWQSQTEHFFDQTCHSPPAELPHLLETPSLTLTSFNDQLKGMLPTPLCFDEHTQPGGRSRGQLRLADFFKQHLSRYLYEIANPLTARQSSSRLSPHLAWGSLSIREVMQAAYRARGTVMAKDKRALSAFISRLHWQSHFMQKLESEPEMEWRCLQQATETLRPKSDPVLVQAWYWGQTGVPLVDACMRCLRATGWLPFRMRAMVMSFASYL